VIVIKLQRKHTSERRGWMRSTPASNMGDFVSNLGHDIGYSDSRFPWSYLQHHQPNSRTVRHII